MAAALALSLRGTGRTGSSPSVGCIIVKEGRIIGRGWTQHGGRPHAEAMALEAAGTQVSGAEIYVTLEPCAHESDRGPACSDLLIAADAARVIIACEDPDPRTAGKGAERLRQAGIVVKSGVLASEARAAMTGFFMRQHHGRPFVTIKLATSLDGQIAMADGSSKWITGEAARRHCHLERARHEAILVGAGTLRADNPSLNVRLPGLESRSPARFMLGSGDPPAGWQVIRTPQEITALECNHLFVEGGAQTAASFLKARLADRLLLYRSPILIGEGKACLGDIGLGDLSAAHGQWTLDDSRMLGKDQLEIYSRTNQA
jgi:diaminohydroxyphosphoribosylaminopyrimidine deaminase / 5-amino-6-(5-phosphoribosylamino)uracil reductase